MVERNTAFYKFSNDNINYIPFKYHGIVSIMDVLVSGELFIEQYIKFY